MRTPHRMTCVGLGIAIAAGWHVRVQEDAVIAAFFAFAGGFLAGAVSGMEAMVRRNEREDESGGPT